MLNAHSINEDPQATEYEPQSSRKLSINQNLHSVGSHKSVFNKSDIITRPSTHCEIVELSMMCVYVRQILNTSFNNDLNSFAMTGLQLRWSRQMSTEATIRYLD
jgi:hypothetical protein